MENLHHVIEFDRKSSRLWSFCWKRGKTNSVLWRQDTRIVSFKCYYDQILPFVNISVSHRIPRTIKNGMFFTQISELALQIILQIKGPITSCTRPNRHQWIYGQTSTKMLWEIKKGHKCECCDWNNYINLNMVLHFSLRLSSAFHLTNLTSLEAVQIPPSS